MERCKEFALLYHGTVQSDEHPFFFDERDTDFHLYFHSI